MINKTESTLNNVYLTFNYFFSGGFLLKIKRNSFQQLEKCNIFTFPILVFD